MKTAPQESRTKPERPYGCWPYTDEDKVIVRMREAETLHAVAAGLGITVSRVLRAEWVAGRDAEGRKLLAKDPESIQGLALIGELSDGIADVLRYRGKMERLSDLVVAGKDRVWKLPSMGAKRWGELEAFLQRKGIVLGDPVPDENAPAGTMGDGWNVIDIPTGRRRLKRLTRNLSIRARWCDLSRGLSNLQDLLSEAIGDKNTYNVEINVINATMGVLWDKLVSRCIVEDFED